jgi:uncharacterized protein YlxW (UPF0749 family)
MPAAEAKNQVVCGPPERIPSLLSSAKTKDEIGYATKAGKQMNRNLAFLLISVLAIVIVILVVFLWQKSSNLDGLSSQLNESRQALTESQTQLAASQQDVEELRTQLAEAQQEIEALQAEINRLKPQLTPSETFVYSGEIVGGGMVSIPVGLQKSEKVEGRITGGLNGLEVQIQDPGGSVVEDLGRILQSNFMFTAQKSGVFTIVIREPSGLPSKYSLQYIIYQLQ